MVLQWLLQLMTKLGSRCTRIAVSIIHRYMMLFVINCTPDEKKSSKMNKKIRILFRSMAVLTAKGSKGGDSSLKVLPPWMITQGMNLTDEQRGEIGHGSEGVAEVSDDKTSAMGNGHDDLKDEYIKAYYAALLKQQELAEKLNQQESAGKLTPDIQLATTSSDRQVGMKSKREEEDEESVEWEEETPVAGSC